MAATGDFNAADVDVGDTHTFAVGTAASNGTLTVDEAGAWSYALDHDNEAGRGSGPRRHHGRHCDHRNLGQQRRLRRGLL